MLRGMDDAELDFRNMGVIRRRKKALDRTEWASVMRKVKTKLTGPEC